MGAARRDDHGLPLRLGDDAPRGRDARARSACRYEQRVVSAHRTPDLLFEYARGAEERGLAGHHRRRRRRGAPARHGRGEDGAAGARRPGRVEGAHRAWTRCSRSCRCRPASRSARSRSAGPGAVNAALLAAAILARLGRRGAPRAPARAYRAAQTRSVLDAPDPARPAAVTLVACIGGGQLGRMLGLAGFPLGLQLPLPRPVARRVRARGRRAARRRLRRPGRARPARRTAPTSSPTSSRTCPSRPRGGRRAAAAACARGGQDRLARSSCSDASGSRPRGLRLASATPACRRS